MPRYMTKGEIEQYDKWKRLADNGLMLTPDGLRFICEACEYDPMKIGIHILDVLPKMLESQEKK